MKVLAPFLEILKRDSRKGANTFTKHYDKHIIIKRDLVDYDVVTPIVSKFKDDQWDIQYIWFGPSI